jgi:hypothetical protein
MTSDEFGEVDIDLLADYIGGALDGPGETEVARLIADDARWRETYELLLPAMAAVGAELTALAPEPMPADLASRLETSFASSIASPTTIDPVLAEPAEPHLVPSSGRHLSSVPGTGVDRPARKRKRLRWAAPIAVAAGVLAFAGFGVDYLAGQSGVSEDAASTAGGSAENAAPMIATDSGGSGLVAAPREDQITSTGIDYGAAQLRQGLAAKETSRAGASSPEPAFSADDSGLAGLGRLRVREALLACLEAISRQHDQGPIEVQTVDYARYEGTPALVVQFRANGATLVWAVGAECGTPSAGADRL